MTFQRFLPLSLSIIALFKCIPLVFSNEFKSNYGIAIFYLFFKYAFYIKYINAYSTLIFSNGGASQFPKRLYLPSPTLIRHHRFMYLMNHSTLLQQLQESLYFTDEVIIIPKHLRKLQSIFVVVMKIMK